jgi:hypothetical protein
MTRTLVGRANYLILPLSLLALLVTAPLAQAKPVVTLSFPAQGADVDQPFTYTYTSSGVAASAQLVLQTPQGTARRWKTVDTLPHVANGSRTGTNHNLGQFRFRIAVIAKRHGRRVLRAQQKRRLTTWGDVDFSHLFRRDEHTHTVPSNAFSYVFSVCCQGEEPATAMSVDSGDNHCRRVHVDWVADGGSGSEASQGTLSVIQETSSAISDTAAGQEVSSVDAAVVPHQSWGITVATDTVNQSMSYYINGTANCYDSNLTN